LLQSDLFITIGSEIVSAFFLAPEIDVLAGGLAGELGWLLVRGA
jgi:hypothetical protein